MPTDYIIFLFLLLHLSFHSFRIPNSYNMLTKTGAISHRNFLFVFFLPTYIRWREPDNGIKHGPINTSSHCVWACESVGSMTVGGIRSETILHMQFTPVACLLVDGCLFTHARDKQSAPVSFNLWPSFLWRHIKSKGHGCKWTVVGVNMRVSVFCYPSILLVLTDYYCEIVLYSAKITNSSIRIFENKVHINEYSIYLSTHPLVVFLTLDID